MTQTKTNNRYNSYFEKYKNLVGEENLLRAIKKETKMLKKAIKLIDEEKANFSYQEGKWTIKELLIHLLDTERVFSYRALAISRKEKAELPSYDENQYVVFSNANERSIKNIKKEFLTLRKSTLQLFKSFTPEMLQRTGVAGGNILSVSDIGFILVGHQIHHLTVLHQKYFNKNVDQ